MCIASIDGKCYDSARACGVRKLSDTEEVNVTSPRFARLSYTGRYRCVDGTTTSQQLFEMAKVRSLCDILADISDCQCARSWSRQGGTSQKTMTTTFQSKGSNFF